MPHISSYDVVRVSHLNEPNRSFDGTEGVSRPPQIGDVGTIVFGDGSDCYFQVESVNADGFTIWLAEFHVSELERVNGGDVEWELLPAEASQITKKLRIGMTRQEVVSILGEPDDVGGSSKKHQAPSIFKYGKIELHFEQSTHGRLLRIYMENEKGLGITLLE